MVSSETEKDSNGNIMQLENPIDKTYKIIFSFFKIFLIIVFSLFIVTYLYYLVIWVYFGDESTTVQPFEITGMKNVSGTTVADLLSFELNHVVEINCAQQDLVSREVFAMTSGEGINDKLAYVNDKYSDLSSRNPSPETKISDVGSVGMGGSSFSVGQLILSFKELARKNPSTITGSLQRYGSTISMVAIWNDHKSQRKVVREARLTNHFSL
jgi:hypothetical protein